MSISSNPDLPYTAFSDNHTTAYRYTASVTHQGMLILLAMYSRGNDTSPGIHYRVMSQNLSSAVDNVELNSASNPDRESIRDLQSNLHPVHEGQVRELEIPTEVRPAGFSLLSDSVSNVFHSKNSIADAQFKAISDGKYIYIFFASTAASLLVSRFVLHPGKPSLSEDKEQASSKKSQETLPQPQLFPAWEVRYRRSGSKDIPESDADTRSFMSMDRKKYIEPMIEFWMINCLKHDDNKLPMFTVVLSPAKAPNCDQWIIICQSRASSGWKKSSLLIYQFSKSDSDIVDLSDKTKHWFDRSGNLAQKLRVNDLLIKPDVTVQPLINSLGGHISNAPDAVVYAEQEEIAQPNGGLAKVKRGYRLMVVVPIINGDSGQVTSLNGMKLPIDSMGRIPTKTYDGYANYQYPITFKADELAESVAMYAGGGPKKYALASSPSTKLMFGDFPASYRSSHSFDIWVDFSRLGASKITFFSYTGNAKDLIKALDVEYENAFGKNPNVEIKCGTGYKIKHTKNPVTSQATIDGWVHVKFHHSSIVKDNHNTVVFSYSLWLNDAQILSGKATLKTGSASQAAGRFNANGSLRFVSIAASKKCLLALPSVKTRRNDETIAVADWRFKNIHASTELKNHAANSGQPSLKCGSVTKSSKWSPLPPAGGETILPNGDYTMEELPTSAWGDPDNRLAGVSLLDSADGHVHLYFPGKIDNDYSQLCYMRFDTTVNRGYVELPLKKTRDKKSTQATLRLMSQLPLHQGNQLIVNVWPMSGKIMGLINIVDGFSKVSETWIGMPLMLPHHCAAIINGSASSDPLDPKVLTGEIPFYDYSKVPRIIHVISVSDGYLSLISAISSGRQNCKVQPSADNKTMTLTCTQTRGDGQITTETWKQLPTTAKKAASILRGESRHYNYGKLVSCTFKNANIVSTEYAGNGSPLFTTHSAEYAPSPHQAVAFNASLSMGKSVDVGKTSHIGEQIINAGNASVFFKAAVINPNPLQGSLCLGQSKVVGLKGARYGKWVAPEKEKLWEFIGKSSSIAVAKSPAVRVEQNQVNLSSLNDFSVDLWINPSSAGSKNQVLVAVAGRHIESHGSPGSIDQSKSWMLSLAKAGSDFRPEILRGAIAATASTATIKAGRWAHVALAHHVNHPIEFSGAEYAMPLASRAFSPANSFTVEAWVSPGKGNKLVGTLLAKAGSYHLDLSPGKVSLTVTIDIQALTGADDAPKTLDVIRERTLTVQNNEWTYLCFGVELVEQNYLSPDDIKDPQKTVTLFYARFTDYCNNNIESEHYLYALGKKAKRSKQTVFWPNNEYYKSLFKKLKKQLLANTRIFVSGQAVPLTNYNDYYAKIRKLPVVSTSYFAEPREARMIIGGTESGDKLHRSIKTDLHGMLCGLRLWERSLTQSEIKGSAKSFLPPSNTGGLISYWRFREGHGSVVKDFAGEHDLELSDVHMWRRLDASARVFAMFINGRQVDIQGIRSTALANQNSNIDVTMGGLIKGSTAAPKYSRMFKGRLAEVRVWSKSIGAASIMQHIYQRLSGTEPGLLCYWPINDGAGDKITNKVTAAVSLVAAKQTVAKWMQSKVPIGPEAPMLVNAFDGSRNQYTTFAGNRPVAGEYVRVIGVADGRPRAFLARCYCYLGQSKMSGSESLTLFSNFYLGELELDYISSIQTRPTVVGFIEGAPPVPAENLTVKKLSPSGYKGASSVVLAESDDMQSSLSVQRNGGFRGSWNARVGTKGEFDFSTSVGVGVSVIHNWFTAKWKAMAGMSFDHSLGWTSGASASTKQTENLTAKQSLDGAWELPPENPKSTDSAHQKAATRYGAYFNPGNNGFALVKSGNADLYGVRLGKAGPLVSYVTLPNPDVPIDWNIIMFPLDSDYQQAGVLDGQIGEFEIKRPGWAPGRKASYYKPIETNVLESRVEQEGLELEAYYRNFDSGEVGRRQEGEHFTGGSDPAHDSLSEILPDDPYFDWHRDIARRSLVNTYVWHADGGLFSEESGSLSIREESSGGSYDLSGGITLSGGLEIQPTTYGFDADAMFGGYLHTAASKSRRESEGFRLKVSIDVEGWINERKNNDAPLSYTNYKKSLAPGKVKSYRFKTFYLSPAEDNFRAFEEVIDKNWLHRTGEFAGKYDASAVALAQAVSHKNGVWRVLHRVTNVERVPTPLQHMVGQRDTPLQWVPTNHSGNMLLKLCVMNALKTMKINGVPSDDQLEAAIKQVLTTTLPTLLPGGWNSAIGQNKRTARALMKYFRAFFDTRELQ